jgi:Protein of unknown function (DUF3048) N-terminal domain/Protein of unknown function (DUF3048) C-terminal domain/PEGA domain
MLHARILSTLHDMRAPRVVLQVAVVLLALVGLPPAAHGADSTPVSACRVVTPPDAPYGCLEILPLGESASITLDDVNIGLSPMGVPEVAPGDHRLRLDRTGYYPWYANFTLAPGEVRRFDPPLAPLVGIFPLSYFHDVWPLAVMVENHPDARPQTGLDQANVVYEALAEGGISRFLAIYMLTPGIDGGAHADVIGPVRSTRHYFVYAAAEYNATLVHVGASPIGYAALTATGIRNVNESWGDPGIWRSARRYAPHNAYTSTDDAFQAATDKAEGGPGSWGPLVFKDPSFPSQAPSATKIRIRYPPLGWYDVSYTWDPETNTYPRVMDGEPHRDGLTGAQLAARNVVVQVVPDDVIDREGRLDLIQTGEGPAYYFLDGMVIAGTWTKADFGSRTFFWDTAGNLVRLNAMGTTWIQLIPPEAQLDFS